MASPTAWVYPMVVVYVFLLFTTADGGCLAGIYLMHGGYCLTEYTVISDIALIADNPLHCVLAGSSGTGGGGQWTGPGNTAVQCGGSGSGPFTCSQSSDPTNITLYKKTGASFSGKQLYTCTISGQSISVQIESNTVLSAIYIEPPADVRSVPQNYTIHCITTGQSTSSITVGLFLERHGNSYYDQSQFPSPVSGYNQHPPPPSTLNSTTLTYDYSEEVVWRADRVEVDGTEFSEQGLTKYNGDHDWACGVSIVGGGYDDLQTYIRAPNFTPTNLTVLHKNATSVTISWTAVDAIDADGYVVYSSQQSGVSTAVDVGNVTQYMVRGLITGNTYSISVRAYQDLLGQASNAISEAFEVVFQPLSWSMLSDRTSPVVQYHVYCTAAYVTPDHIVWRMNGTIVVNSSSPSVTLSHQLVDAAIDNYTNILTVTGDHRTQTISCAANYSSVTATHSDTVLIEAPSGPPVGVATSINSSSSITVSWSPPVGGADGYVILYSTEGSSNMTQLVEGEERTSSLLTGLSEGHLYIIRVFAYKDLPSLLSHPVHLNLDVPSAVSDLKAVTMYGGANTSITWSNSHVLYGQTWFTISYYSESCPNISNNMTTELSSAILQLEPGQRYSISVTATNTIGSSIVTSIRYTTPPAIPVAPPGLLSVSLVNSSSIAMSWQEVPCRERNGNITGYIVEHGIESAGTAINGSSEKRNVTILHLDPLTEYSMRVAAVNSEGVGPFTDTVYMNTSAKAVNRLTCLSNGTSAILIWHSIHFTKRHTSFAITYAESQDCNTAHSLSFTNQLSVLENFAVIRNLRSLTCYHFIVKTVVDGYPESEGVNVTCRTSAGHQAEAQSLLATIFIPTAGGLGGGVVVCATVLMTITVIAIIKRCRCKKRGRAVLRRNTSKNLTSCSVRNSCVAPFQCVDEYEVMSMGATNLYATINNDKELFTHCDGSSSGSCGSGGWRGGDEYEIMTRNRDMKSVYDFPKLSAPEFGVYEVMHSALPKRKKEKSPENDNASNETDYENDIEETTTQV